MGKNYIDIENDRGEPLRYRKHTNGRGLIAHGAKVHPSAIIEAGAYVEPGFRSPRAHTSDAASGSKRTLSSAPRPTSRHTRTSVRVPRSARERRSACGRTSAPAHGSP